MAANPRPRKLGKRLAQDNWRRRRALEHEERAYVEAGILGEWYEYDEGVAREVARVLRKAGHPALRAT